MKIFWQKTFFLGTTIDRIISKTATTGLAELIKQTT